MRAAVSERVLRALCGEPSAHMHGRMVSYPLPRSGNTLGTRYLPCQAASEGIFSHSSCTHTPAPWLAGPSGPQYWRSRRAPSISSTSTSGVRSSGFYVYTFFADHVTSSPAYVFLETAKQIHPRSQPEQASRPVSRPRSPPLSYGYRYTASPRPISSYPLPPIPSDAPNPAPTPDAAPATLNIPPSIFPVWSQLTPRTPPPQSFMRTPQLALNLPESGATTRSTGTLVEAPLGIDENGLAMGELDADGMPLNGEEMEEPNSPDKTTEMVWPGR